MKTDNKRDKILLLREYKEFLTTEKGIIVCMLGEEITKNNYLTIHHIRALRNGGGNDLYNKSLLSFIAHCQFNMIELYIPKKAEELNDGIRDFKKTKDRDIIKQLKEYKDYLLQDLDLSSNQKKLLIKK